MRIEKNPSREEIVRLLAKASDCRVLSSDRYAQGMFESLCFQRPEGMYSIGQARVSLVQYITVGDPWEAGPGGLEGIRSGVSVPVRRD